MAVSLFVFVLCLMTCHCDIVNIDSMECVHGKELCSKNTCLLTVSRNNMRKINVGCYLPKPIYNMSVDFKVQLKRGRAYETLVSAKENLCEIVRKTARSQFMARAFEQIRQYVSNFRCPFVGNVSASNLPIGLSFVPGFIPKAQYRLFSDVRNNRELIIAVEMKISIGPKKKANNKKN